MGLPISHASLPSSMSQNHRNETTPPVQSNTGATRSCINPPSLETPSSANLDSGESTRTRCSEGELRRDVAQCRPDTSRPTHGVISESAENNNTSEASAKTGQPSITHVGNNTDGSNVLYGAKQDFTGATVRFGGGHSAKASNKSERRKRRKSYSSNKNKAAVGPVEGGAHHECFKHFGDNDNGVNVSYAGEQNFQNGNISFGVTERRG